MTTCATFARANLDFVTGQMLAVIKIDIDEAVKGQVSRPPSPIPANGAAPNSPNIPKGNR